MAEFRSYEQGLADHALRREVSKGYKPKHTGAEYLAFIAEHAMCFKLEETHPQGTFVGPSDNVFRLFTEATQDVYGDSLAECLDHAMERIAERRDEGL